tara:strand:+ start:192 stop:545 length:354 start_codon:yes stop_codon:yes gene_type:complete
MEDVEKLLKGTVEELDQLLNAKNVLGDPIEREGATVIPIVSYGFGFGAGGKVAQKSGNSAGTGAGGGIKPLGAIIFDKEGARVESVKGALTSMTEIAAEAATAVMDKMSASKKKSDT